MADETAPRKAVRFQPLVEHAYDTVEELRA